MNQLTDKTRNLLGFLRITFLIFLCGCMDVSKKAEENLNLLKLKALVLDSIIAVESQKLNTLDSTINYEMKKAIELDSIVRIESQRIDSLLNKVYQEIKEKRKQSN